MQLHLHSLMITFLLLSCHVFEHASSDNNGEAKVPCFAFSWLGDNNTFQAGDTAIIKIKVLGLFDSGKNASLKKSDFQPVLTVNDKVGNSSFVSGVLVDTSGDTDSWRITFTPIRVGIFNVLITDEPFKVLDSSLHFEVVPGLIYPSVCIASWLNFVSEFNAGEKAEVMIVPRDAFGNNVTSPVADLNPYNLTLTALYANGSIANIPEVTHMGWNKIGFIGVEFIAAKAGNYILQVTGGSQTMNGSPLPFRVYPGPLDVSNCQARWKFETNAWQIFSKMEIFIHQQDKYGNLVPGLYEFDADVVEKETNLSTPVADLQFEEVEPGIQLFTFSLLEPGNFLLTISDLKRSRSIFNMPFPYTVFTGYTDGSASIVNGSGLNGSAAGEISKFSFYLNDIFQYPSLVKVESIRVLIVKDGESDYAVQPSIHPVINGTGPAHDLSYGKFSLISVAPAPAIDHSNTSREHSELLASSFNVFYALEKSGMYDIYVFCGNILLNGGHSFRKEVRSGDVNTSLAKILNFGPKVPKSVDNEILVQLMDSFSNPVLGQESRLQLEIASLNRSGFSTGMFVDNYNGSYTGHYSCKDVGTYEMCVSFDGIRIPPCPFGVNVYSGEYFPKAYDDNVSVWEDESIAFDVLLNDYFAGHNASIVHHSKPARGSLLQYGHFFRYTPYIDYYGNDSFTYTISDVNGNLASASVYISVINIPPQFVSLPSQLKAMEDMISPKFGGFSGFEIKHSDPMENISVTLRAEHGTVLLSPMAMQLWQGELNVKTGDNKDLIFEGSIEIINLGLQSLQYLGKENFSGNDTVRVCAGNMNGKNELDVPVIVEPFNDPPFINVPEVIILKEDENESMIFDRSRDKFEFCVGDPDLLSFPGKESEFIVTFSVEVDDGFLVTSLAAELINTTEVKLINSFKWQPLQTYVTISNHFTVKAKGIRFQGTLRDCNNLLQKLSYHGRGAILTLRINDMGHHGCYLDCGEKISMPLYAEATTQLFRTRLSSFATHTFGTVIAIESIAVLSLGMILLFFSCKCAILLVHERYRTNVHRP